MDNVLGHGSPIDTVQNIGSHISHPSKQFHSKFCTDKLNSILNEVSIFKVCIESESENIDI